MEERERGTGETEEKTIKRSERDRGKEQEATEIHNRQRD